MTMNSRKVLISTTIGAKAKTFRSAPSGKMSSFWRNLAPSASSCMVPKGPASFGPTRLCMPLMTLKRNT